MVSNVRFIPQIMETFGVSKEYAMSVFLQAQATEATVWLRMAVAWVIISAVIGVVTGYLLSQDEHSTEKHSTFVECSAIAFVISLVIVGLILVWIGNIMISSLCPEYTLWDTYIDSLNYMHS